MTTVSIRLNEEDKQALETMCDQMGMNISTFYMICTKRALRDRRIPFDVVADPDPFWSPSNIAQLKRSDQELREGNVVRKTMEELRAYE